MLQGRALVLLSIKDPAMQTLLSMQNINKAFFGVNVLKGVDFDLKAREVHFLLGENGAGKSTLIKILSGAYSLDSGSIVINNDTIDPHSYTPKEANNRGIVTIYQNFHLIPHLSVAENISLADFATRHAVIDWKKVYSKARTVLDNIQFSINPRLKVQDLGVSEKQMLEIAIALSKNARIIIMDEPTAAISKKETETLFQLIHEITRKDIGIIYISHRLEELQQIGDRVTILRDGYNVSTLPVEQVNVNTVVNLMTGKEIQLRRKNQETVSREILAEFSQFSSPEKFRDVHFSIYKGEVLGLTGVVGSGKTELARSIFGADPLPEGEMTLEGKRIQIHSPKDAIRYGMGYLPEDRDVDGLCLNMGVKENITLVLFSKLRGILFGNTREKGVAQKSVRDLRIKTSGISQYVKYLSGGNKQKVVFAKWLSADCRLLLLDEPTIGIDVGAREEIYDVIHKISRIDGKSILFISSDIQEILRVSDRILVMARGRIVKELSPKNTSKQQVMEYCLTMQ